MIKTDMRSITRSARALKRKALLTTLCLSVGAGALSYSDTLTHTATARSLRSRQVVAAMRPRRKKKAARPRERAKRRDRRICECGGRVVLVVVDGHIPVLVTGLLPTE